MLKHQKLIHGNPDLTPNSARPVYSFRPTYSPLSKPTTPISTEMASPDFKNHVAVAARPALKTQHTNTQGMSLRTDIPSIESILTEMKSKHVHLAAIVQ